MGSLWYLTYFVKWDSRFTTRILPVSYSPLQCCGSDLVGSGRIRIQTGIRSDLELFAGSGVGSGINHFGSGSGQPGSGMNLKPNFSGKKSHFLNQMHQKLQYLAHIIYIFMDMHTYMYTYTRTYMCLCTHTHKHIHTHTHTYIYITICDTKVIQGLPWSYLYLLENM